VRTALALLPRIGRPAGFGRAGLPPLAILLPAALLAAGTLLPVAYLVLRALGADDALGLLVRPRTGQVLVRSLVLAFSVAGASTLLAVPLAWLTLRTDLPARRLWSVLTVLPLVVPSYVGGFAVIGALGPRGLFQQLLAPLGVERLPEIYGFTGAWLTLTLFSYPYLLLAVRAAVLGLDPGYEEAARSLGHGPRRVFLRTVLPQLRPAVAAGALLVCLYTLSDFGAVSLLQYDSFSRAIYVQYRGSFDRSLAAVLSLVLVMVTVLLLTAEARLRGRRKYHRSGSGVSRRPELVRLGRWRWPALGFCAAVALLGVAMPVGITSYWLLAGIANGEPISIVWRPLLNSVSVSAMAAAVTAAAALPVALLAVRYPSRLSSLAERTTYAGYALPPIATALALVFFVSNYVPWLYQTLALLVIAYTLRFVPQAVGPVRTSLLQIGPNLEDAARSLGRTSWRATWAVTVPLVRPGLTAGAALVFLTTMKELPATLLLSPIGFSTLATQTWSATSEAFFARAAASALLLIAFSSLSMFFVLRAEASQDRSLSSRKAKG
jgi:iron(III) transport system permease protein